MPNATPRHGSCLWCGLFLRPSLQGENADLLVELGYQLSLSGTYDSAMEAYQAGARANEGDVRAMTGVVYCQVRYAGAPQSSAENTVSVALHMLAKDAACPPVLVSKSAHVNYVQHTFFERVCGKHHRAGRENTTTKRV